jgi:eukaryotic-like serine/threonine-protein kinase
MSEPTPALQTEANDELLADLADDFLRRYRAGERPTPDEYIKKHPELADRIRDLLSAALAMEQPGVGITFDFAPDKERVGGTIGRYKLLERIGEGGFGIVYMAEQQHPIRRKVALKVIKPGFDTQQVIARFEAERQALALMEHENIAKVLDAGATESGRPYFVMELVRGVPITEFCDGNELRPVGRLELFMQVCRAVQHAHTKGIIHRDIKPTNVLVTLNEGVPVPKVIDFGVAKATSQQLTEKTLFTQFAQMVGTPLYMSPEQAEMTSIDVDTRSDVYSLGVLLYELLTGTTPLDKDRLKRAAFDEVRRIIREEEPPRPSTRLSTLGEQARTISARRKSDPRTLGQFIRGELDWIVMKCLEKERSRRYDTASGLARDIERYLRDETVEACPPSAPYRLRKFARRHRIGLLAGTGAVLTLLILLVVLIVSNRMIAQEGDRKEAALNGERKALALAQQRSDDAARNLVAARESERTARHALYAAQINLAQQSAASADVDQMLELLNSLRPDPGQEDLRGFEWYYLWRLCHKESLTLQEFSSPVRSAVYSPNGKVLATSEGAEIKLWDPKSGALVATLKAASSQIRSVVFSPDGALLAVGGGAIGGPGEVRLWDVATNKEQLKLPLFDEPVCALAFSPDGKSLGTATAAFIASRTGTFDRALAVKRGAKTDRVKVWKIASGTAVGSCEGPTESVLSIAFSPNGEFLAAGTAGKTEGEIIVWRSSNLHKEIFRPGYSGYVSAVTFSPDGKSLATAAGDWFQPGQVIVWSFPAMQPVRVLLGYRGGVTSVAYSPDGKSIATGSHDRTVCIWRTENVPAVTFLGHRGFVSSVAFAPDGRTVASSSWDNTVRLWDVGNGYGGTRVLGAFGTGAAFLPDGRLVLNGPPEVIDRPAGTLKLIEKMSSDGAVAVSSDGRMIAIGDNAGNTVVWDSTTLKRLHAFHDDIKKIWSVAFSPHGYMLASGGDGNKVTLRDLASDRIVRVLQPQGRRVRSIGFSPDGSKLATATWESGSTIQIWDVGSGEARRLEGAGATSVAFSPDGRVLAAGRQNHVSIYDARSWKILYTITGHGDDIWQVAFSRDGKTLASTSWDGTLRLWSVRSGELLLTFRLNDALFAAAFSGDGRTLAATASHTNAHFWDAADPVEAEKDIDGVLHRSGALKRQGKIPEAEQLLRVALGDYRQRFGEPDVRTARVFVELASALLASGNAGAYPEAESLLIKGHDVIKQKLVPGHEWRLRAQDVARALYGPAAMNNPRKLGDFLGVNKKK